MKKPSSRLLNQTVTVFTPVAATGMPVNGGASQTWTKTTLSGVRYTVSEDNHLHLTVYNTAEMPAMQIEKTLIVLGNYTGTTPPYEGSGVHYYCVSQIRYRYEQNGIIHNIGVDAA